MIEYIKSHKVSAAIGGAVVLICIVLLIVLASQLSAATVVEEIPSGRIHDAGLLDDEGAIKVHDSADGEILIRAKKSTPTADVTDVVVPLAAPKIAASPEDIWTADTYAGNHTPVEKAQMADGSLGVLTIPSISLSVNVYESPDNMEAMSKGVAHFPNTSAWDGNVGMSGHNINLDGSDGHFKDLHTLKQGDTVTYQTALGERTYAVEAVNTITASDWSPLGYTDDHRITLITCISGQPDKRLAVTAMVTE
jgi:LPXTG-site transpeptidase (sortase) family protein